MKNQFLKCITLSSYDYYYFLSLSFSSGTLSSREGTGPRLLILGGDVCGRNEARG